MTDSQLLTDVEVAAPRRWIDLLRRVAMAHLNLVKLVADLKSGWLEAQGEKRGRWCRPSEALRKVAIELRVEVNGRLPAAGDPYA